LEDLAADLGCDTQTVRDIIAAKIAERQIGVSVSPTEQKEKDDQSRSDQSGNTERLTNAG
jgi:hypothetical protein